MNDPLTDLRLSLAALLGVDPESDAAWDLAALVGQEAPVLHAYLAQSRWGQIVWEFAGPGPVQVHERENRKRSVPRRRRRAA